MMHANQFTHYDAAYNHITSWPLCAFATDNTYNHNTPAARFDHTYSHFPTAKQEKPYEDLNDSSTYNHLNAEVGTSMSSNNNRVPHRTITDAVINADNNYSHINQNSNEARQPRNTEYNNKTCTCLGETLNASSGSRNCQQFNYTYIVFGLNVRANDKTRQKQVRTLSTNDHIMKLMNVTLKINNRNILCGA